VHGFVRARHPGDVLRILYPSQGLSLDPIGYSYVLPRLGWDHQQASANYPGCGIILTLTGYKVNPFDMVQAGLATHLASDSAILPILREGLASMLLSLSLSFSLLLSLSLSWNQQGLGGPTKQIH
jgi:hypothetical protein